MQKCFLGKCIYADRPLFFLFPFSQVKMNMEYINKSLICSYVDAYTYANVKYYSQSFSHFTRFINRVRWKCDVEEKNECIFILIFFYEYTNNMYKWKVGTSIHLLLFHFSSHIV